MCCLFLRIVHGACTHIHREKQTPLSDGCVWAVCICVRASVVSVCVCVNPSVSMCDRVNFYLLLVFVFACSTLIRTHTYMCKQKRQSIGGPQAYTLLHTEAQSTKKSNVCTHSHTHECTHRIHIEPKFIKMNGIFASTSYGREKCHRVRARKILHTNARWLV